ncbi:MAG TPA: hypothetical protein VJS44_02830 [Pyrinomonadaceae bacterium]|nr:hypothetical protein [Pyrinomonadaceae bacterium]
MKEHFNIFHFFSGAFIPAWLLSRSEVSAGAKLAYSLLAQQANSRGIVQLNFQIAEASIGERDGRLARYLMELEDVGLIHVSRGNVHQEDIRIYFPHHQWMIGLDEQKEVSDSIISQEGASLSRLFPREVQQAKSNISESQQPTLPLISADSRPQIRRRKGRRRWGRPQSKHSREICYRFAVYNVEVLGSKTIYDLDGFTDYLYRTGEQDAEIDEWLVEQANAA